MLVRIPKKISLKPNPWEVKSGIIHLDITPTKDRKNWKRDLILSNEVIPLLDSSGFERVNDNETTKIVILPGALFTDDERTNHNIRTEAYKGTFTDGKKLTDPSAETACFISRRFHFEDMEAMGLRWVVSMHKPIRNSGEDPGLLVLCFSDCFSPWIILGCGRINYYYPDARFGFAFEMPNMM